MVLGLFLLPALKFVRHWGLKSKSYGRAWRCLTSKTQVVVEHANRLWWLGAACCSSARSAHTYKAPGALRLDGPFLSLLLFQWGKPFKAFFYEIYSFLISLLRAACKALSFSPVYILLLVPLFPSSSCFETRLEKKKSIIFPTFPCQTLHQFWLWLS